MLQQRFRKYLRRFVAVGIKYGREIRIDSQIVKITRKVGKILVAGNLVLKPADFSQCHRLMICNFCLCSLYIL